MKRTIITALIASLTGIGGYYIGKHDLFSRLSLAPVESSSSQSETADQKHLAFSAKCVIQLNPYGKTSSRPEVQNRMMTRHFFQTEFNVIKGKETIERAIQDYKLDELTKVDAKQLADLISSTLKTSQEQGTDLIVIEAFGETEEQAQQILYAVVTSYETRRKEAMESRRSEVIEKYKQKIEAQEDKVEDNREKLYKLLKKQGITYSGTKTMDLLYREEGKYYTAEEIYQETKREADTLEALVVNLTGLSDDQFITKLIASNRPEKIVIKEDLKKLKELEAIQDGFKKANMEQSHPKFKDINISIDQAKKNLKESVDLSKEKLNHDLKKQKQLLATMKNAPKTQPQKPFISADYTQFRKAKDDYKREFAILQTIKDAELLQTIETGLEIDLIRYHKYGWTPEIKAFMEARLRK